MKGLEISGVEVAYGAVVAVAGVELRVAPGEIVALVGPSGSGKSSLLRAVAGLEPLAAGSIRWDGEEVSGVPVHRRGFAVMFQDGQLFPHLSVAGNAGYALHQLPRADRAKRVEEILHLVELDGYGERPITALSGGQAQRVALARSLAAQPRMLLLDEPLSALDRGLREHLVGVLGQGLRATGTPAIYVTHDQDEAFAVADRVGVLVDGRLRQVAVPTQLWRHPVDRTVAAFLGYGPFLDRDAAGRLGWPAPVPAGLIGIGPDGLEPAADGVPVRVLTRRQSRAGIEFEIVLPGELRARITTDADLDASGLAVRVVPDGCVVID